MKLRSLFLIFLVGCVDEDRIASLDTDLAQANQILEGRESQVKTRKLEVNVAESDACKGNIDLSRQEAVTNHPREQDERMVEFQELRLMSVRMEVRERRPDFFDSLQHPQECCPGI